MLRFCISDAIGSECLEVAVGVKFCKHLCLGQSAGPLKHFLKFASLRFHFLATLVCLQNSHQVITPQTRSQSASDQKPLAHRRNSLRSQLEK